MRVVVFLIILTLIFIPKVIIKVFLLHHVHSTVIAIITTISEREHVIHCVIVIVVSEGVVHRGGLDCFYILSVVEDRIALVGIVVVVGEYLLLVRLEREWVVVVIV
jgi:hypothetical protein